MSAIKKIVKIAKKDGLIAKWSDSGVKFDIHMTQDPRAGDTYVITQDSIKGKVKDKYLDPNLLYKSVKANILLKLHQKNLVLLFNSEGKALAIKKIVNINLGIYQKRQINKFLTMNEPAFVNLFREMQQMSPNLTG